MKKLNFWQQLIQQLNNWRRSFRHWLFGHYWNQWSDPMEARKTYLGDRKIEINVQIRTCQYCNVIDQREIK